MHFDAIGKTGAYLVQPVVLSDARGQFSRSWCAKSFGDAGIAFNPVQGNTSRTHKGGSIRGMHFQRFPRADAKIVRCAQGLIHDVIVDLREESPTSGQHFAIKLTSTEGLMLYIPAGFAHGFQTLADDVVVEYLMGEVYVPELYDGFRYDDRAIAIDWPEPVTMCSENDARWPDLLQRMPWLRQN